MPERRQELAELKMKLGTGEEIALAEFGHDHIVMLCEDLEEFREKEDKIRTDGALDSVEVTSDGEKIAQITGLQITGAQTVGNTDGTVTGHFYMTGGTYDLGGEYAEAGRILLGEE